MKIASITSQLLGVPIGTSGFKFGDTFGLSGLFSGAGNVGSAALTSSAMKYAADQNYQSQLNTNLSNERSVKETNQANKDIADATNKANYQLWQAQNDEQWKMWNAENQFNSPAAQRERLKAAGLNPALAMSQGVNTGTASSMTAPSPSPAVGAEMQPFRAEAPMISPVDYGVIGNAIQSSVSQFWENAVKAQQAKGAKIDNAFRDAKWQADIAKTISENDAVIANTSKTKEERNNAFLQNVFLKESMADSLAKNHFDALQTKVQIDKLRDDMITSGVQRAGMMYDMWLRHQNLKLSQQQAAVNMKVAYQQISLMKSQGKLNEASMKKTLAETNESWLRQNNVYCPEGTGYKMAEKQLEMYGQQVEDMRLSVGEHKASHAFDSDKHYIGLRRLINDLQPFKGGLPFK